MKLNLSLLKLAPNALRNIKTNSIPFMQLRESIERDGILSPLTVYRKDDHYIIIDGDVRFVIANILRIKEVECNVISVSSNEDAIRRKIILNNHCIAAERSDIKFMIERLIVNNPKITLSELSDKLTVEKNIILNHFKLKINISSNKILEEITAGKIPLSNAILLSRLPMDEQIVYLQDAETMDNIQFKEIILQILKSKKKRVTRTLVRRNGSKIKKPSQIRSEIESLTMFDKYVELGIIVDARSAYRTFGAWALGLDPSLYK